MAVDEGAGEALHRVGLEAGEDRVLARGVGFEVAVDDGDSFVALTFAADRNEKRELWAGAVPR